MTSLRLRSICTRRIYGYGTVLALTALLLLCPSCGNTPQDLQEAVPPAADLAAGIPFPEGRQSSEQVVLEQPGDDAIEYSSGSSFKGSTLVLKGSSSSVEFGTFEFSLGDAEPLRLLVDIQFDSNASAYLALANYETGRWQFFGKYTSLSDIEVELTGHSEFISPGGSLFVAAVLYGPYSLAVEGLSLEVEQPVVIPDPNIWPTGAALAWIQQWYLPLDPNGQWGIFTTRDERAWANTIFQLTNAERQQNGLAPLVYEPRLEALAQAHTKHFTQTGFWSHTNPQGLDPWQRLDALDPPQYNEAGENMAAENESPTEVFESWMASDGHRRNILNSKVTHMGIGVSLNQGGHFKAGVTQIMIQFLEDPLTHNWIEPQEQQP